MTAAAPPILPDRSAAIAGAVRGVLCSVAEFRLRAIVLTGSLARDEGTWRWSGAAIRLIGDVEFLAVFEENAPLPSEAEMARVERDIEAQLRTDGIEAHIGISAVRSNYLTAMHPHMFAYELVEHGQVISGEKGILDLVPRFSARDIPFEDGFRTLLNRLIELLEAVCQAECLESLSELAAYRAAKLLLDMASSYLIFARKYESTYRRRATRIEQLASSGAEAPISLELLARQVRRATNYKLGYSELCPIRTIDELCSLISELHSLWAWELAHLAGAAIRLDDVELLRRWLREQPLVERLRGWMSLAKRRGLSGSIKSLPQWMPRGLHSSPRRLVYAAASELFFALPALLRTGSSVNGEASWQPHWKLPVMAGSVCGTGFPAFHSESEGWRRFGRDVAWHYHQFLESTRS